MVTSCPCKFCTIFKLTSNDQLRKEEEEEEEEEEEQQQQQQQQQEEKIDKNITYLVRRHKIISGLPSLSYWSYAVAHFCFVTMNNTESHILFSWQ